MFLLAIVLSFIGTLSGWAQSGDFGENNALHWELTDGTLTISGTGAMPDYEWDWNASPWYNYRESVTDVIIDDGVNSIGSYSFYNCINLSSVIIPNSVITINSGAFSNCGLSSVIVPNFVTFIGQSAFSYCSKLTSIIIPNSVTSIHDSVFTGCRNLISIDVNSENSHYSSEYGVLFDKNKTTIIQFPEGKQGSYSIPNSVTNIGNFAFKSCTNLTTITIPNSVTTINYRAFESCSGLTSITIPNSVTTIHFSAFSGCSNLISIDVNSENSYYSSEDGVLFDKNKTTIIQFPEGKQSSYTIPNSVTTIDYGSFDGCSGLTSITIPNSVTSIEDHVFINCSDLTSIEVNSSNPYYSSKDGVLFDKNQTTIIQFPRKKQGNYTVPNSVTSIKDHAFWNCSSLTSITISNSVTSIGNYTFERCTGLTSITIPNSVTNIGSGAFLDCYLTNFINHATIPQTINEDTFNEISKMGCTLFVPISSMNTYRTADIWNNFNKIIAIRRWQADYSTFPNTMTYTANIVLDNVELQSANIEIGAFVGEECRGAVTLRHYPESSIHPYLGFLTVHGNSGEEFTFKVHNRNTGKEYTATNSPIAFTADAINGNSDVPYTINITNNVTQQIALNEGWSWISTNVTNSETPLLNQFKQNIGNNGTLLKARNQFIQAPYWIGTLSEMNNTDMYMVNATATHNLSFTGLPVNTASTPVYLQNGWNWIGYTPQQFLLLSEALNSLSPQDGDQIKSRSKYSTYVNGQGWVGSLTDLYPGNGYKYYSTNAATQSFTYPSSASPQLRSSNNNSNDEELNLKWTANSNRFANTMTLTSVVELTNEVIESDKIEIGAFCGDECRGTAQLKNFTQVAEHPYMGFLVVYGENNEDICLKVYNHETGEEYATSNSTLPFVTDAIHGSPVNPYPVKVIYNTTEIYNAPSETVTIYLDLQGNKLNINYPWSTIDRLEIVDLSGRVILQETDFSSEFINISSFVKGAYILKILKNNKLSIHKFIK